MKIYFLLGYILFLAGMLIFGISDPQYKFFALGGLSAIGFLLVLSFFK